MNTASLDAQNRDSTLRSRDVAVRNGGVTLGGTLFLPAGDGHHPAVVLLSGSGAQTRAGELYRYPLFTHLARALTARNIAVLACDDRGTGASTGMYHSSTLDDFASDACAALALLRGQPEIDPARVGLLGHSEGGAVAQLAALGQPAPAFIIMLAGPGVDAQSNILLQTELIARANSRNTADTRRELRLLERVFAALRTGAPAESLRPLYRAKAREDVAAMTPAMRRALRDTDAYGDVLFTQQMEMMDTPWFRSLIRFDPARCLPFLPCPLFAMYGGRDLQVPAWINRDGIARFQRDGCGDRLLVLPEANHLFQRARSGSPAEYGTLPQQLMDGVPGEIAAWIAALPLGAQK
jgi:uncharacterized protein